MIWQKLKSFMFNASCYNVRHFLILEGLFIQRLMLRFPPILAGRRNWMHGFHRLSNMRFLIFHLLSDYERLNFESELLDCELGVSMGICEFG